MKQPESDQRTVLGITLTKRGWNNVVIYTVLIAMFLLYFSSMEGNRVARDEVLRPFADNTIVELSDASHHLVRVGNRWQLQRGELSEEAQQRWLQSWQNLELTPHDGLLTGLEYRVEVTLADAERPVEVAVFFTRDRALVGLPGYDQVFVSDTRSLRPEGANQ
ncbi:hypothetical protein ACR0ST_11945 [Aliidiomarina sp. Khilg15.8]